MTARAMVLVAAAALPLGAQSIAINLGTTNRTSVLPNDEITVPLIVNLAGAGATSIASMQAGLTWNAALLTFDSLRVASGLSWAIFTNTANAAGGVVTFNAFDAAALPATATLANAYFTSSGAEGGTRIDLDVTAAGSATGANVLPFVRPRSLDVCVATPGRLGDVNGDDAVNIIDAQQISRFTVGLSVANPTLLAQRGDVNQSGAVDIVDGQQIARFSVGLSAAPLIDSQGIFVQTATGVEVTPGTNQSLATGASLQLFARPFASATTLTGCAPVNWTSSNTSVAVVNASGFVTAIGGGTAAITASSGTASDMLSVAVSGSSTAPVASVTVALAAPTITVGATTQATATLRDANSSLISNRPVTWSSSNPSCAAVNSTTGLVTGVAACSATIIATAEGVSGQDGVSVMLASVSTVAVSLASSSLAIGAMTQATAVLRDLGGTILTGRTITWSSSNTSVATVNSSGVVTAVASGTASIRATAEGITGQTSVTVAMAPVANITVALVQTSISATTPITTTTQASVTLRDASGNILTGRTVTWSSSNTARVTVNSSGVVTAVSPGTADIIATCEGVTALRTITIVTPPVATVTVALGAASIIPGGTTSAVAVLRDDKTNVLTGRAITFTSSNTSVATAVLSSGAVTGLAVGTANIVATSEGRTGQVTLTVAQVISNEPPDMTLLTDRKLDCQKPTECESDWGAQGAGFSVVHDSTAPWSRLNVGQMRYPAGMGGGAAPGNTWRGTGRRVIYVSLWVKYSGNFQAHSSGVNKIFFMWIDGSPKTVLIGRGESLATVMALQGIAQGYSGGTTLNPNIVGSGQTSVHLLPNVLPTAALTRNQWHRVEMIMTANAPGVADGSVTMYQNGVKVSEYRDIMFTPAGRSTSVWQDVSWNPTWGGTGGTVTSDMYLWMDHVYISGRN